MSGSDEQVPHAVGPMPADDQRLVERREALRRFGMYAAATAPALTVLLASRQSKAGKFPGGGATGGTFPGGGATGGVFPGGGKGGGKGGGGGFSL
jgi:uncharacterized membrane protein